MEVRAGRLHFAPTLLQQEEFLGTSHTFDYLDTTGRQQMLSLPPKSLAFTICQTPVVYTLGRQQQIEVITANGRTITRPDASLDTATTRHILDRDGFVQSVHVVVEELGA